MSNLNENMHIENPQFYFYMFKLISTPNIMTMKRLVYYGYISYNRLQVEVMELFYQLYQTPIECRVFRHVLNSYLTSYLQCIINEFYALALSMQKPTDNPVLIPPYGYFLLCKIPVNVENSSVLSEKNVSNEKSTDGLLNSNSNIFDRRVLDNQKVEPEIPINVNASDCIVPFSPEEKNDNEQLSVCDFQSFLFPLQQDYTKSSKGYYSQNKHAKNELENAPNLLSNYNFQHNEELVNKDTSDDEYYDPAQNLVISRYLNSLNSSSSEDEVSCNEICYDSDSDDSLIVFSENILENTQRKVVFNKFESCTRKKIEVDIFSYDSDNDDSLEFLENSDSKCLSKSPKGNMKNTNKDDFDSKTTNSDFFERYDDAFSFSLHQNLNSSFKKNDEFLDCSFTFSQDKMNVHSTEFGGFLNPCFEEDSSWVSLKTINDEWENSMKDISCEPRQPKRVSFVPLPDLVTVQIFEPDEDNYRYSIFVLDQIRFKHRIQEFEEVIKPYLTPAHRANVYKCNSSSNDQFLV